MEPKALMGIWFEMMREPFLDLFPLSEIDERKKVGWQLVLCEQEIDGWWKYAYADWISQPVRKEIPDDNGANDKDE